LLGRNQPKIDGRVLAGSSRDGPGGRGLPAPGGSEGDERGIEGNGSLGKEPTRRYRRLDDASTPLATHYTQQRCEKLAAVGISEEPPTGNRG